MAEDLPVGAPPIVYRPGTFARHADAVDYVEGLVRTRIPPPDTGRAPRVKPGAWGLLAPGDTITAGSGLSLGSGTVTLCTQNGTALTDTGESVTVYNNGAAISAPAYGYGDGLPVAMEWTEAGWSACVCEEAAGCTLCVTVLTCTSLHLGGATVTLKRGGTTLGTCTTDVGGGCCFDIAGTGSGDYVVPGRTGP
jgi:hypothetical protein